jgi:hypothetical protein
MNYYLINQEITEDKREKLRKIMVAGYWLLIEKYKDESQSNLLQFTMNKQQATSNQKPEKSTQLF